MPSPVDLPAVLATIDQPWSPRTVAVLDDYDLRVVHTRGEFTRHSHPETDEVFLVLSGSLTIRMDDGDLTLGPGQLYVVPKGTPHQPYSPDGRAPPVGHPGPRRRPKTARREPRALACSGT
ncbi:cupin domain-containing protein [Blastococcus capsensis]|uniref:cupin domain-containing protein n=1 Tax=Blastococcus capsensis TaxID=1564163 RepID=UPI002541FD72|nr:cupin domain-containing protein [Blastococcus capsensis]MDK3257444.1 cupin domain-containing protein [Blastococcus capsensis]